MRFYYLYTNLTQFNQIRKTIVKVKALKRKRDRERERKENGYSRELIEESSEGFSTKRDKRPQCNGIKL